MYDAIVIGARCSGSPTAMLLARKSHRVLLVDRAAFPSDTMKNHFIHHEGIVQMHRWGLLGKVQASNCPPVRKLSLDLGEVRFTSDLQQGDGVDASYGPRRFVLDQILVEAAADAGAEVRERFSVLELLSEGDRVTGIRGRTDNGAVVEERAPIVVGADGHHSMVARTVKAETYNERPTLTCGYYSYWSGLPCETIEVYMRPKPAFLLAFPTNDGLTCVAIQVPVAEFATFRTDVEASFSRTLDLVPELAERVRVGKREHRFLGTADLSNFFRKPYGPGWALVGDAGYHKDPIEAQGISDAFRDAELLANAIDAGLSGSVPMEGALTAYERTRNEYAIPRYEQNYATASFKPLRD